MTLCFLAASAFALLSICALHDGSDGAALLGLVVSLVLYAGGVMEAFT